jgi:selenide,water dikinase
VGFDTTDVAAVFRLTPDLAMIQTLDFITPILDDPRAYGRVAAANSISDVYAMGGRPVTALSLLVYPEKGDMDDLEAILKGGADKIHESGCVILGGHSITEDQVKFGYAVTGLIDPRRVLTNAGAKAGDVLVFTKKIGTGVISTALKKDIVEPEHMAASIAQMLALNKSVAEALSGLEVHGCTDVTGFSLLGHAREMALASNVTLEIFASKVRYLPGAIEYSKAGAHSNGLKNNRDFVSDCVTMPDEIPNEIEALLYDPQTSGGLLLAMPEEAASELMSSRPEAYFLGRVCERGRKPIEVKS